MLQNKLLSTEDDKDEKDSKNLKFLLKKINNKPKFSLDKIKKFIIKRNKYNNSLEPNNSDEYLLKLKKFSMKKLKILGRNSKNKINKKISSEDNMFLRNNNSQNKLKLIKNISKILSRNNSPLLKKQRSVLLLPKLVISNPYKIIKINNQKILNLLQIKTPKNIKNIKKPKNYKFIIPKEIIDDKILNYNQTREIKISSFLNKAKENELFVENPRILDINEMNNKFNMNLNFGTSRNKASQIFNGKRYTISGMLNKMYHYYASDSDNKEKFYKIIKDNYNQIGRNSIKSELYTNNTLTEDINIISKKTTLENNVSDIYSTNINSDNSNVFLTKLTDRNNFYHRVISPFDIEQIIKNRYAMNIASRRNNEIMKNNSKISANLLNSRDGRNITTKKILYKYLDRSLCTYGDDPSYLRIKEFDKRLEKLLKRNISF